MSDEYDENGEPKISIMDILLGTKNHFISTLVWTVLAFLITPLFTRGPISNHWLFVHDFGGNALIFFGYMFFISIFLFKLQHAASVINVCILSLFLAMWGNSCNKTYEHGDEVFDDDYIGQDVGTEWELIMHGADQYKNRYKYIGTGANAAIEAERILKIVQKEEPERIFIRSSIKLTAVTAERHKELKLSDYYDIRK